LPLLGTVVKLGAISFDISTSSTDQPFLEIGQLAATGLNGDEVPGAGIITGIGRVSVRRSGHDLLRWPAAGQS
jgi:hypothetical protein